MRGELVLREVDASELPVLADVAHHVDQLERDPERLRLLRPVGAVHADAGDPDRSGDVRAVVAQRVEAVVALPLEVDQPAVDEIVERLRRDREAPPRVGERDPHRLVVRRRVQPAVELLQPHALLFRRRLPVRDVVHLAREGVDRGDRAALGLRQDHDPEGKIARPLARDPLDLRVRLLHLHAATPPARAAASKAAAVA